MGLTVTVSQLNAYTASVFRENKHFRGLMVKGEISNFVNHTKSGHFYFTLKEGGAAVKAVMFSRYASSLRFMPENGMSVVVSANVEVYERDGVYQLYVSDMLPDGAGALYMAVEQLKEKLSAEGIFNDFYKKPLPSFPSRIGIVTSREAAALRDIVQILSRRYPVCEAVVFPCLVQGEYAPASIKEALEDADASGCDVIICGRGGGSIEDLMAFNSEIVARAIFACNTPVISAVGHETDTTIADLAADVRASTPSAAAELAVPEISELKNTLELLEERLKAAVCGYTERLEIYTDSLEKRLELLSPQNRIRANGERLDMLEEQLKNLIGSNLQRCERDICSYAARLDALSPLKVMSRGFSVIYKDGNIISSAEKLKSGDRVEIRMNDGSVGAVIG